jgi:hypothetical protein
MHDAETLIAAIHRDWGEAQGNYLCPCQPPLIDHGRLDTSAGQVWSRAVA